MKAAPALAGRLTQVSAIQSVELIQTSGFWPVTANQPCLPVFLSTGVSPDESGDDEDDDEGGGCPVSQSNSIDGYVDFFQHSNRYFRSRPHYSGEI